VLAATSFCTNGAGLHRIGPVEDGFTSIGLRFLQHLYRCWINTLLL
jgi:hypothetical protein